MPHNISLKVLRTFLAKVPWIRVSAKAETAEKGDRLFPSRTPNNDRKHNFRLDRGSEVQGKPEIVLQANKNAEDKNVRQAAGKDSHAVLAKVVVGKSEDEMVDEIETDFDKRRSS